MTGLWRNVWVGAVLIAVVLVTRHFGVPGGVAIILSVAIIVNSYRIDSLRREVDELRRRLAEEDQRWPARWL